MNAQTGIIVRAPSVVSRHPCTSLQLGVGGFFLSAGGPAGNVQPQRWRANHQGRDTKKAFLSISTSASCKLLCSATEQRSLSLHHRWQRLPSVFCFFFLLVPHLNRELGVFVCVRLFARDRQRAGGEKKGAIVSYGGTAPRHCGAGALCGALPPVCPSSAPPALSECPSAHRTLAHSSHSAAASTIDDTVF